MSHINSILNSETFTVDGIEALLSAGTDEARPIFERAYEVKKNYIGTTVYFRGLIELSNICEKNCLYCGIRRGNRSPKRYMMKKEEILEAAHLAWKWGYGSVVLQSGEITSEAFILFIEDTIMEIKKLSNDKLGITLSLGEQTDETYRRWFDAGAHRYLLRIETSNPELYAFLHPGEGHCFDERLRCLESLKKTGYQTGTGIMIGLPGQSDRDIAEDILFFKKYDADMIGMGPYIPHHETPLAAADSGYVKEKAARFDRALRVIALTRIVLKNVNIASTTALQTINGRGRELGLLAGANVIMPNMTPLKYRHGYLLYDDKPGLDENAVKTRKALEKAIIEIGENIGYGRLGDSPHFAERSGEDPVLLKR